MKPDESQERVPGSGIGLRLDRDTAGARVLLVEENDTRRASLQRLLSAQFMVEAVADGRTALEAVRRNRPDLVLSAARSRKLDGVALVRALRAEPITHAVPIILMVGRNQKEVAIESIDAGADGYLMKPFAPGELVARVSGRIAQWRLRAELAAAVTRRRLANELHDCLGQTLVSADLVVAHLMSAAPSRPDEIPRELERLRSLMRVALAEMQVILHEMRPETIEQERLGELMEELAGFVKGRLPLNILLETRDVDPRPLPSDVQHTFYRIAQESLENVVQHAGATRLEIRVAITSMGVELRIRDDGLGFDPGKPSTGGLLSMRERAASIGARLAITSSEGEGTQVVVHWARPFVPRPSRPGADRG
jgi:signal transduction histidine kinase